MQRTSDWLQGFKSHKSINQNLENNSKEIQEKAICISVTGGKGGVGKTSVALKFAREMSKAGKKVLLIDCDYNLSNTKIKLGLPLNSDFSALLSSQKTFDDCLYKEGTFHLLSACNGDLELFDSRHEIEQIIIDIIYTHESEYDFIILDCPAGISKDVLTLNAYCDHRIVVVTPDKSSITDSYSLIKVLKTKFGVTQNHLLVNMVSNGKQYKKVVNTLSETIENFLGCRTHILGGVKRQDESDQTFDNMLFKGENSDIHKNFVKVLGSFTEKLSNKPVVSFVGEKAN